MELCNDGHDEVCFDGRMCPACDNIEDLNGAIESLEKEVKDLEKQVAEYEAAE